MNDRELWQYHQHDRLTNPAGGELSVRRTCPSVVETAAGLGRVGSLVSSEDLLPRVRVVVVDDHEIVRAGLTLLLRRENDIDLVGTADTGERALAMIAELLPDIAVVDYNLPGMNGIELCECISSTYPAVAVILLTTYLDDFVIRGALDAGALAYVYKDIDAVELKRAIRLVARGEAVLDPKVAARVASWARRRPMAAVGAALSRRETEVLRLIAGGLQNREIAREMHVTENTVRTYVRRLLAKLDSHGRGEAVAVATRRKLL